MIESEKSAAKICSCFGHHSVEITQELRERTAAAINDAIDDGVREFLFGGLSDFDDLVYEIVSQRKSERPELDIKRTFCFPLDHDLHRYPHWFLKREYESLECPQKSFDYWYKSLYFRNCAMIDESDIVLFYAEDRPNSGAYKAYQYAIGKHKKAVNLANS